MVAWPWLVQNPVAVGIRDENLLDHTADRKQTEQ